MAKRADKGAVAVQELNEHPDKLAQATARLERRDGAAPIFAPKPSAAPAAPAPQPAAVAGSTTTTTTDSGRVSPVQAQLRDIFREYSASAWQIAFG